MWICGAGMGRPPVDDRTIAGLGSGLNDKVPSFSAMRTIGLLIFPDFQILDAAGPVAAFEIAARYAPGAYEIRILARDGGLVASSSGARMYAEAFADAPRLDTLMISGGE